MSARKSRGFTLIELLVAMAISALIVAALGALFFGAFGVFNRLEPMGQARLESASIGLEKIAGEIQTCPVYAAIPLKGEKDRIEFPLLVYSGHPGPLKAFKLGQAQTRTAAAVFEYKRLEYFYDSSRKSLMRRAGSAAAEPAIAGLAGVEFSYAVRNPETKAWLWQPAAPEEARQLEAVRIRLLFDKNSGYSIPGVCRTFLTARVHPGQAGAGTTP